MVEQMRQEQTSIDKAKVLEAVLDCMDEAVVVVDRNGEVLIRNRAFEQLHFPSQHSIPVEQWSDAFGVYLPGGEVLCPADQLPLVRAMRGESFNAIELEHVGPNHPSGLPISVAGRPLIWPDGRTGGVIVIRDNSVQRKISEALVESEEQYRSVVEALAEGVVIHTNDGAIVASNDKACEILGLTHDQIAGRTSLDPRWAAVYEDGRPFPGEEHPAMAVLQTGQPLFNTIMGVRTPSGALKWITVNAVPIRGAKGTQKGVVASFHEITEARTLSERLQERNLKLSELNTQLQLEIQSRLEVEKQYRAVVEDQTEIVSRLRVDGTITFVNEVYCRTFGKSQTELIGKSWQPAAHPDDVDMVAAKLATLSPTNPIAIVENRVYNAEGNVRWMEFVNRGFFDSSGTLIEIQSVGRDITDRRKIEEQLRNSLHEKEVLLKEIHHRVKNNLQVVSTLLELQTSYTQDPAAIEMFRESRGRVKIMGLIHENLYRSRDMSLVDIRENISQLAEHLRFSYNADKVEIEVDVASVALPIDAAITCGLLVNELLSNSLKHAFEKGARGHVRVGLQLGDTAHFVLSVADNGIGFPEDLNFYDTKTFGMKLVHMLARQLQGKVEMKCEHGTKITVTFPVTSEPLKGR